MRIAIVGAGAMGSILGGRLAVSREDLVLLSRTDELPLNRGLLAFMRGVGHVPALA